MFCPNCGKEVGNGDRFCTFCSYRLVSDPISDASGIPPQPEYQYRRVDTRSTGWALFLSILFPGLGALYVDSEVKGLFVFIASLAAAALALFVTPLIGLFAMFVLWVYGIFLTSHAIDSYKAKNNIP